MHGSLKIDPTSFLFVCLFFHLHVEIENGKSTQKGYQNPQVTFVFENFPSIGNAQIDTMHGNTVQNVIQIQIQIQILYSPSFTTRKVSRKR